MATRDRHSNGATVGPDSDTPAARGRRVWGGLATIGGLVASGVLAMALAGLAGCGSGSDGGEGGTDSAVGDPVADAADGTTGDAAASGGGSTPVADSVIGGGSGGGGADDAGNTGGGTPGPDVLYDPDATAEAGTFGAPCDANQECFSGWCVEGPGGFICTRACDESCPTGFDCKAVAAGSDVVFLCMPRLQKLCTPCTVDQHCNGGKCLELDGESWCGFSCDAPEDCPAGYGCQPDPLGETPGSWCQPTTGMLALPMRST